MLDIKTTIEEKHSEPRQTKLYKRRWFILFLYVSACLCGTFQWVEYVVVSDVMVDYYKVTYEAVNWTNLITLLNFLIFTLPFCYVLDKYGIRVGAIVGTVGVCIPTWVKVNTVSQDRFWLVIVVQGGFSLFHTILLNMAPKVAANWFGPNEVSLAYAIGLAGAQLGVALGYVLPPLLIQRETIENDLFLTNVGLAIACTIVSVLVIFYKPQIPPSYASMNQTQPVKYIDSIKQLMKIKAFVMLLLGCGINIGVYVILQTVLNQIILRFYQDRSKDVGVIGLLMVITGIFGSLCSGFLLDKFKAFRFLSTVFILFLILISFIFTYTLNQSIICAYFCCCLFGFFAIGFYTVCFQIGIETAYPLSESVIVGMIYGYGQGLGVAFTYVYSYLFYELSPTWANNFISIIFIINFVILMLTNFDLKRSQVNTKKGVDRYVSNVEHNTGVVLS